MELLVGAEKAMEEKKRVRARRERRKGAMVLAGDAVVVVGVVKGGGERGQGQRNMDVVYNE